MPSRLVVVVALAALGCGHGGEQADAAAACEVDQAPAEAFATCGPAIPHCCGLPWCGPDVPDDTWFCATHGGASWCCACADPSGGDAPRWSVWKMECGLGPSDGGADGPADGA
jgi:hypothetical protein